MSTKNGLSAQYDAACKEVLSHKMILAHIMKDCMVEYAGVEADVIARQFIETEALVSQVLVEEGGEEWLPRIQGTNTEDTSVGEGRITYDIRFTASLPTTGQRVWIDVEPQKDFWPGYSLLKRGIYYLCRMISAQRGREFAGSDYDELKKAYSIWICLKPPKKFEHTIKYYEFQDRDDKKYPGFEREKYDLMTLVMICLGDPSDSRAVGVLRLLSVLFTNAYDLVEKQKILKEEFNIVATESMRKGMKSVCNFGEGIYEEGFEKGIEKGIGIMNQLYLLLLSKGRYEELEKAARDESYRNLLMREFGLSFSN